MNKYEIILSVCETHSISKTAEKLCYTQSAISQAIKGFEKDLGLQLFKRSKHGMELMPNTEEIIEALKIICREENRITQIATNLTSLDSGYIRIGTIQSISYHWLPDILRLLRDGGLLMSDNVLQDGTIMESRYAVERRDRTIHERMREYLYTLKHMDEFETSILPVGDGVALSVKKGSGPAK